MSQKQGGWCGPFILFGVIGFAAFVFIVGPATSPQRVAPELKDVEQEIAERNVPSQQSHIEVGQIGKLRSPVGGDHVWLCLEDADWTDMVRALDQFESGKQGSRAALERLAEAGKIKAYPVGTRVMVKRSRPDSLEVKVLEDKGDVGLIFPSQVGEP